MEKRIKQDFWNRISKGALEENRFGIAIMVMLTVACLGGITQIYNVSDSVFELAIIVFPMMLLLSLIIAVQPIKLILNTAVVAIIIDLIVIAYELIFK